MQKWRLAGKLHALQLPFLAGALYLGTVFLKANKIFGRVYFADLSGAGLCGLAFLVAMYFVRPENLIVVPLILWFTAASCGARRSPNRSGVAWLRQRRSYRSQHTSSCRRFRYSKLAVSTTRAWPSAQIPRQARAVYERTSPFGYLEVYSSSYLHFAPGLSDNAAFTLPKMPDTPISACTSTERAPAGSSATCRRRTRPIPLLPMVYPYLIKPAPDTFVVQFGGASRPR